jgi:hypothetical protein
MIMLALADRAPETLSQPNALLVNLKFFRNPMISWRGRYISIYQGCLVFADSCLEALIRQYFLIGQTLEVKIGKPQTNNYGEKLYTAKVPPGVDEWRSLVKQNCQTADKRTVFLIDGQNLTSTLGSLHASTTAYQVIKRVEERLSLSPIETGFYICEDEASSRFLRDLMEHQTEIRVVTVPKRQSKNQDQPAKRNIDPYLIAKIADLRHDPKQPECLVLFGGDGDLSEALKKWAGLPGIDDYSLDGQRPLVIVASTRDKSFSGVLKELANAPNVKIILIEDLID